MALQKPNSEKIKMIKQVIGGAGVVLGAAYAVYSAVTGDYSVVDILGGVGTVMLSGEIGRWGEEEAKRAKEARKTSNNLERAAEEEVRV